MQNKILFSSKEIERYIQGEGENYFEDLWKK